MFEMVNSISCVLVWACTSPFFQVALVAAGNRHLSAFTDVRMFGGSLSCARRGTHKTVTTVASTISTRREEMSIVTLYNPRSDEEAGPFSGVRCGQRHTARC